MIAEGRDEMPTELLAEDQQQLAAGQRPPVAFEAGFSPLRSGLVAAAGYCDDSSRSANAARARSDSRGNDSR